MTALLQIDGIAKSFGAVRSLVDVTFTIENHGIVGLIGPNGAGKSTLINVLTGVYAPTAGTVRFNGRDLASLSTAERARAGLVRTFQRPHPIFDLSCVEGVMIGGLCRGLSAAQAKREALEKMELLGVAELAYSSPRKLATGLLKLLDFLRVLMVQPKLVLLDELMAGLSAAELGTVQRAIEHLMREGVQFLIIEHLMGVIRRLSQHLDVMDAGVIVTAGQPETVISDSRVIAAYLGEEAAAPASTEFNHA